MAVQRVDGLRDEQLGRRLAELVLGLSDRGEGRGEHRRELDVVVPDNAHVARHPHLALGQGPQHPEGDLVVHAQTAVGRSGDGQELLHCDLGLLEAR